MVTGSGQYNPVLCLFIYSLILGCTLTAWTHLLEGRRAAHTIWGSYFSPTSGNVNVGGCFFGWELFLSLPLSPTVFVLWFFVCVCVWFTIFIYSLLNCGWIHQRISAFVWKLFSLLVSYSFFSLTNLWNYETVINNSSLVNNKFHLFLCICATRFNSKILQNHTTLILHSCSHLKVQPTKFMGIPAFWLARDLLKVKLFVSLPPVGSIYIFLMYLVVAMCQQVSDLAWQIQMLVTAETFKEIILQRFVGAKGSLLVKNRNSIPLEFKQILVITFYHTCFAFSSFLHL